MISARQFAEQYSGHVVKMAPTILALEGISADSPIGTVVGFRPGTKGVVGSSKVAIWRGENKIIYALEPKTDLQYTAVVENAESYKSGIYFLSVNAIELVMPKASSIVSIYSKSCKRCGSPARKSRLFTICSNKHCKINSIALKTLGPFVKVKVTDSQGFVLCPFCQNKNLNLRAGDNYTLICCNNPHHTWRHDWKDGQKIFFKGHMSYTWSKNRLEQAAEEVQNKSRK